MSLTENCPCTPVASPMAARYRFHMASRSFKTLRFYVLAGPRPAFGATILPAKAACSRPVTTTAPQQHGIFFCSLRRSAVLFPISCADRPRARHTGNKRRNVTKLPSQSHQIGTGLVMEAGIEHQGRSQVHLSRLLAAAVASCTEPASAPLLGSAHAWFVGPRPEPCTDWPTHTLLNLLHLDRC